VSTVRKPDFDVAVVGASLAGCAAATLYARRGARVALIEKATGLDHYKVICGHFIQAGAAATIDRLGLRPLIQAAGSVPGIVDIYTPYGWIMAPRGAEVDPSEPLGVNLRRQTLDPIIRRLAAETPGVDLLMGATVDELLASDGRVSGVAMRERSGTRRNLGARLVVAADGRDSNLARLAAVPARLRRNLRLGYQMYFHDLQMPHGDGISQIWFLDGHNAYAFPNEDGITAVAAMPTKELLPEFRRDREQAYFRFIEALPDAPPVRDAEPASKLLGKLDLTNRSRPAAARGMAFIGDAATAADPVWGVGCGWALESAEWLVEATAERLESTAGLEVGLQAYRRRHRNWLGAHNFLINDFSGRSRFSRIERRLFAAAARDRVVARAMRRHGARLDHPTALLRPGLLRRVLGASAGRDRVARRDGAGGLRHAEATRGAQPVIATPGPGRGRA